MSDEPTKEESSPVIIKAYKGFDAQMRCRAYQFEVGKTYNHEGPVKACESGWHSCENPLDVFRYYEPGISMFAEVEASGEISRHEEDSKVASARLHIKAAISVPDLITRAFEWVRDHCTAATSNHATGDRSASSATGARSASSATGDSSASLTTGWYGKSEITSDADGKLLHAVAIASGRDGKARAPIGSAIVLVERDEKDGSILHIRASKVGDNGIKADVWYSLKDGEFMEHLLTPPEARV